MFGRDIIEVENFLPKLYEKEIFERVCAPENFNWKYIDSISHINGEKTFPAFFNIIFQGRQNIKSEYFDLFYPLICSIPEKTGIQVNHLLRLRLGLILKEPIKTIHPPHIDYPGEEHYTALYYINESDGDTYIYNQVDGDRLDNFTIKKQIKPKKGKFAIFNGKHFHSSSSPEKYNSRFVLTINFS